jgi:tetratricopeptide (TPR) repeat protein
MAREKNVAVTVTSDVPSLISSSFNKTLSAAPLSGSTDHESILDDRPYRRYYRRYFTNDQSRRFPADYLRADMPSAAVLLKEEGNKLFTAGKFTEAREKYTEAISKDEQNAALFANRAACALNLKEYLLYILSMCTQPHMGFRYRNARLDALKVIVAGMYALDCLTEGL